MKYFSVFSGLGGFEVAIHDTFKKAECVGFSEIDKFAIKTYVSNFPDHSELNYGDIERLVFDLVDGKFVVNEKRVKSLPDFDLLIGGSPCQDLSIARAKRAGLEGQKSRLFYAYAEILRIKKPKYFILENVASMSKTNKDKITNHIKSDCGYDVEPMEINAALVSAQKRKRLYWFNWNIEQPEDNAVLFEGITAWSRSTRYKEFSLGDNFNDFIKNKKISENEVRIISKHKCGKVKKISYVENRNTNDGKANTLTTGQGCGSFSSKNYMVKDGPKRLLTIQECEKLQGLPIGWTRAVSKCQAYKQIGNGVQVDVIKHILKGMKK